MRKKKSPASPGSAAHEQKPLLGALLRLTHEAVTEQVAQGLAAVGFADVPAGYLAVVQPLWLAPEGLAVAELAARANLTRSALKALVERLEALGYVTRSGRARRVHLSERGKALVATIRGLGEAVERVWAERLGRRRIEVLRQTLTALVTEDWG